MATHFLRLSFALPVLLVPLGCGMASLPLPEDLATAEPMRVEGRQGWRIQQTVRFGPYSTSEVERSWTRGRDRRVGPAATSRREQTFEFTLLEAGSPHWRVACRANLSYGSWDAGVVEIVRRDQSGVQCTGRPLSEPAATWRMNLQEQGDRPLAGTLSGGGVVIDVVGSNRVQGALPAGFTTGYNLRERDRTVAAVEVMNDGAVWIAPRSRGADGTMLAAAAATLLLLEDLRGTMTEGR
jgi:hypothetical protein